MTYSPDVTQWRNSLSTYYTRSLDTIPIYPLTDNPVMANLRGIYIRTDLCDAPGWPPMEDHKTFIHYNEMFTVRKNYNINFLGQR